MRPPSRLLPLTLMGLLLGALQLLRFSGHRFGLDDAWISFRVARNLLDHGVLTFNPSLPPVEGMTNLLWTLASACWIAALPGVDPIFPARMIGALLHLGTILMAMRLAGRAAEQAGGNPLVARAVGAALIGSSGSMAFYAMSGLETPLWGFLFVSAAERFHAAIDRRRGGAVTCGVLLGLLALCRPEGILVGLVFCGWLIWQRHPAGSILRVSIPLAFIVGALESFRMLYYGSPVPNTFFAKPPAAASGIDYLLEFLLIGTGGIGLLAAAAAARYLPALRLLPWVLLLSGAGTVWSGGDWMPGYRRFTVAFLCLVVLAAAAAAVPGNRRRWLVPLAVAAIALGNLTGAVLGRDRAGYNTFVLAELGRLAQASPAVREVALTDIGRFGWQYHGRIFDLVGLTDAHIARLPGRHGAKPWDEAYFRRRAPDLVLIQSDQPLDDGDRIQFRTRSSEQAVVHSMLTHGGYDLFDSVAISAELYVAVFKKTGLDLPPEPWSLRDR